MINTQKQEQQLTVPQELTYQFFQANRYKISQVKDYEAICNNGFIKLYKPNGRVYWHTQNQFGHQTPDWKFHVSVKHKDIKKAWNLCTSIFLSMNCRSGMKVYYLKECEKPQPGRQITIYILKYFRKDFSLSIADQHSMEYWITLVRKVEAVLKYHQIQSNGLAVGDLNLGGKYVSLRNQAFVLNDKGQHVYPPNQAGWNPLEMEIPIRIEKLKKTLEDQDSDILQDNYNENSTRNKKKKNRNQRRFLFSVVLPVVAFSFFIFFSFKHKGANYEINKSHF